MEKQFEVFNTRRNKVIRIFDECCRQISDDRVRQTILEKKEKLQQDRFVVSVFGHFSNGKSTFLNSLMGFDHEVLKEDDPASTATITRLKYAHQTDPRHNKVDVIFKEGMSKEIKLDELEDYIAENRNIDVAETIKEVIIYIDSEFLKNGVEIVDTPGFNSTYQIHSEIAFQQVEKSDAAIFLFSCEKPGNSEELEFLKKVNRYMSRVFFVLNKIDVSNDKGRTEKESIYRKMEKLGIETDGKRMYPLSSKRAREALADHVPEKLDASGLPEFMNALINYLTSDDFVRDRILLPLGSAYSLLENEKNFVIDQIAACNKDRNELNIEIQNRKKEIRERENELSDKKRHIGSSVKSEIQAAKSEVKHIAAEVSDAQSERLSKIKSKFDIRLANFEEMNLEAYLLFSNKWESAAEHLEGQLLHILDTSMDYGTEYEKISDSIASAIRFHLQLERMSVEQPDFDFTELSKIDEEITKAKAEYDKMYNKSSNLYGLKNDIDESFAQIDKLETELARLRNKKEKRIESLLMVQVDYGYEMQKYDTYVKRSKIGQFFLGDKRVERERRVEYVDDRHKKAADAERREIEAEFQKNRLVTNEQIKRIKAKIDSAECKQIDREIARAEMEEKAALDELMRKKENQREEKRAMEAEIISIEKEKYLREFKKEVDEMKKSILNFLDRSQKNFVSIISMCLDSEARMIENEKTNIEKMVSLNSQTPEEIEQQLVDLNSEFVNLSECMKKIENTKGEI